MEHLDLSKINAAAQAIRLLSIEAISSAKSGHLGLPLGCAETASVLWARHLAPKDKFVLSAGHGSMLLYSLLHLSGALSLDEIKRFRQKGSQTPGHPEFGHTPGVSCTTGPLGQGIANAAGMAVAKRMLAEEGFVYALTGDGCLQEGISYEACALAGLWKLGNLVLIYDQNNITLDAMASRTQNESLTRFEACGWEIYEVDGHNIVDLDSVFAKIKLSQSQKPKILVTKTIAGKGIPEIEGKNSAHGEAGVKFATQALEKIGWTGRKPFEVPPLAYEAFPKRTFEKASTKSSAKLVEQLNSLPALTNDPIATRVAGGLALNIAAKLDSSIISGSADLFSSTRNYLEGMGDFSADNPTGRNLHFGIREHAMAAICNGIAYDGRLQPVCATFMVFSDYMRPAMRLAALSGLPSIFFLTHDSIFVGEDGPTHQPVEHLNSLRLIPNLFVWRPADAEETLGAMAGALNRKDGPSALTLSRQNLPLLKDISPQDRRQGALKGGYVAHRETSSLERILIASGSELAPCIKIAKKDTSTRVVSMPCLEAFKKLHKTEQDKILPPSCQNRIIIEAAIGSPFAEIANEYIAPQGFGQSAPASALAEIYGLSAAKIEEKLAATANT